jgi:hypothetical protein
MLPCQAEGCSEIADAPMLIDDVWAQVAAPDQNLCIRHVEARLGREIVPADLQWAHPLNAFAILLYRRATGSISG